MNKTKKFLTGLCVVGLALSLGCTKKSAPSAPLTPPAEFLRLEVCELELPGSSCTLEEFYKLSFEGEKDIEVTRSWRQDGDKWVVQFDILKEKTQKLKMAVTFAKEQVKGKAMAKAKHIYVSSVQESQEALLATMVTYYQPVANKVNRKVPAAP